MAIAHGDGVEPAALQRFHGGELRLVATHLEPGDLSIRRNHELVAEQRGHAELLHERLGELREGVGDHDDLTAVAQLVQEFLCARQRIDSGDGFLDLLEAEAVLAQDAQAPVHELVVIGFIARCALELGDAARLCERDPNFGNQYTFHIEAGHVHEKGPFIVRAWRVEMRAIHCSL